MSDTYRIVLTGKLEPGNERASVVEELVSLFRISAPKAETLLNGNETVIKQDVDSGTAAKYEQAVRHAGAGCRVVTDESASVPAGRVGSTASAGASNPAGEPPVGSPGYELDRAGEPPPTPSRSPLKSPAAPFPRTDTAASQAPSSTSASQDPYAPPAVSLVQESLAEDLHEAHRVGAGRGIGWLVAGTKIFARAPVAWILVALVYMILTIGGSLVPLIGPIAVSVLFPIFIGGIMIGADRLQRGDALQFADLFSGFSDRPLPLAALGGIYLGGSVIVALVVGGILAAVIGGNALVLAQMAQDGTNTAAITSTMVVSFIVFVLILVGCLVPLYMALWFAPPLIALHPEIGVWQALELSFKGCLRNMVGLLLYGIAFGLMLFVAAIPLGLGLLVAGPILLASIYASYREIFVE